MLQTTANLVTGVKDPAGDKPLYRSFRVGICRRLKHRAISRTMGREYGAP